MKIRRGKNYFAIIVLFIFMNSLFVLPYVAEAKSNINFSQSILPVKFVYLNSSDKVSRVWSNVDETDNLYVVKFFSEKNKKEIAINRDLISEFRKTSIKYENNNLQTLRVDFIEKGNILEEVHTFV